MAQFPGMGGTILVTGASGFVGGAVCSLLHERGYSVRGTGRKERPVRLPPDVGYRQADLTDRAAVAALCEGVTAVIHTAAKAGVWGPELEYRRANVDATANLLDAARESGVECFVFTSTPSVVFSGKPIRNGDETMAYGKDFPRTYPATKAEAEQTVLAAHEDAFRTLALRPHLIWGPGDPHLFPRVFERADAGRLRIVGDGRNRVDLTYIDNVASGHLAALEALAAGRGGGRAYFLTQDEPVALWPFINELLERTGRPVLTRKVPLGVAIAAGSIAERVWKTLRLKGEPPMTRFVAKELGTDHWFSSRAARDELGYQPTVSVAEGMDRTLERLNRGE